MPRGYFYALKHPYDAARHGHRLDEREERLFQIWRSDNELAASVKTGRNQLPSTALQNPKVL